MSLCPFPSDILLQCYCKTLTMALNHNSIMNFDMLAKFSAGSSNDSDNKHLWLKGASLIIDQLSSLIKIVDQNYYSNIVNISSLLVDKLLTI